LLHRLVKQLNANIYATIDKVLYKNMVKHNKQGHHCPRPNTAYLVWERHTNPVIKRK